MSLPFFYAEKISAPGTLLALDEAAVRHITQVLRMKKGDRLCITNGRGKMLTAVIREQHKKECNVYIEEESDVPALQPRVTIAMSLLKNASRFEWFLEKATETGVNAIVPLICERTERTHFRIERMKNILVSAMLQSRQSWLPELSEPVSFATWIGSTEASNKYIAHCMHTEKTGLPGVAGLAGNKVIGIGPEGDFTPVEIEKALHNRFVPVSLGDTRLRTETAGVAAAILLRIR
ncbi:MAG: 16S rRNA (uracil(1498)-N(3))-methyltransferase [Chitinophagaceae bacterium]|nr:16S rRNA (uracil(1498)-N(3))-methyltransferase [Chitinophagaceae bacterium]